MSQILQKQSYPERSNGLFESNVKNSSAHKLVCQVCSKGLEEGYPVTAKSMNSEIMLFCDVHYSLV